MRVDLLRHGEPLGGARYWGGIDVALSPKGWEQMRASVAGRSWDVIVSSPLKRCAAFAEALAAKLGVRCRCDSDLREMSFGTWEGHSAEELLRGNAARLRQFWADPSAHTPPGGEPLAALQARVMKAWRRIVTAAGGERILIVTHSGPIRLLLAAEMGMPLSALLSIEVLHAAVVSIECQADGRIVPRVCRAVDSYPRERD